MRKKSKTHTTEVFKSLGLYKLVNKRPVLCKNFIEWAEALELNNRRVDLTVIGKGKKKVEVSTKFIGIADFNKELFETMIFGPIYDEMQFKYRTYLEAVKGHAKAVEMVKDKIEEMKVAEKVLRRNKGALAENG